MTIKHICQICDHEENCKGDECNFSVAFGCHYSCLSNAKEVIVKHQIDLNNVFVSRFIK